MGYLVFLHLYPGDGGLVSTNDLVVRKFQRLVPAKFPCHLNYFQFCIEGVASRTDPSELLLELMCKEIVFP